MKSLGYMLSTILSALIMLTISGVVDALLAGVIGFIVSIWDKTLAIEIFKWTVSILIPAQTTLTILCVIRVLIKGEDKSGT